MTLLNTLTCESPNGCQSLGEALHLIDSDWAPFENEAAAHYAQVSRMASRADAHVRDDADTREVGLQ